MKSIDRKNFITLPSQNHTLNASNQNYYLNKPYKIGGGQSMTDIFTHAVMLDRISDFLDKRI